MKIAFEGRSKIKILQDRNEAEHIKKGSILKEQMAETRGGQIIEIGHKVGDKEVAVVFVDTIISGEKGKCEKHCAHLHYPFLLMMEG